MTTAVHSDWLDSLRRAARTRADAVGLPTRRDEAWKYTDLGALGVASFALADRPHGALPSVRPLDGTLRLMLVNGTLMAQPGTTLPAGVLVDRLDSASAAELVQAHLGRVIPADRSSLAALNGGLFTDGLLLHIGAGVAVEQPIEIVSFGQAGDMPLAFHPRCLMVIEEGASATLIERHLGSGT